MPEFWEKNENFSTEENSDNQETNSEVVENKEETTNEEVATEEVKEEKGNTEEVVAEDSNNEEGKEEVKKEEEGEKSPPEDLNNSEASTETQTETETEESSLNKISELTNGEFSTEEELLEAYQNSTQKVSGVSVLEQLNSQVEEIYGEGITMSDVLSLQNQDFENMEPLDVIVEGLYLEDPDITDIEIRAEIRKYKILEKSEEEIQTMIDDGDITREDIEDVEALLMRNSKISRNKLMEMQSEVSSNLNDLEFYSPNQQKVSPENTKSEEEMKADLEYYESRIKEFSLGKIQVGTNDEPHEVNIETSDEDRNGITELLSNGEDGKDWINKRWMGEDGRINMDQLAADAYKMNNYERDMKIAFQQGGTAKVRKEVENIDNIDFNGGQTRNVKDDSTQSEAAKVMREIN